MQLSIVMGRHAFGVTRMFQPGDCFGEGFHGHALNLSRMDGPVQPVPPGDGCHVLFVDARQTGATFLSSVLPGCEFW